MAKSNKTEIEIAKEMFLKCNEAHRITIYYMLHLIDIVKNAPENKMDENNLSLMFSSSFFGDFPGLSPSLFQQYTPFSNSVTRHLISIPLTDPLFVSFLFILFLLYFIYF